MKGLNPQQRKTIRESFNAIYDLLIKDFINMDSDSSVSANFITQVREFTLVAYQETIEKTVIFLNIDSYLLQLRKVYLQVNAINYLIDNEAIRSLLDPNYALSEKAAYKKKFFSNIFIKELQSKLDELSANLFSTINEKVEGYLVQQGLRLRNRQVFFKILENTLPEEQYYKLQNRIGEIPGNLKKIERKLTQSPSEFQDILPLAPGATKNNYNPSPEQWALNFIRIATFSATPTSLDAEEINRLLNQMLGRTTPDYPESFSHQVLTCLHLYISQPHLVPKNKFNQVNKYIEDILTQKDTHLGNFWRELNAQVIIDEKSILPSTYMEKLDEDSNKWARLLIHKYEPDSKENLKTWLLNATKLYESDKSGEQLIDFTVLSVIHNLSLPHISKDEVTVISWLCTLYLFPSASSKQPLPVKLTQEMPEKRRIEYFGQHLVTLLTTLKFYSTLYGAEWLTLMTRTDVNKKLKQSDKLNPFILRVSNSEPNSVLISYNNSHALLTIIAQEFVNKGIDACKAKARALKLGAEGIKILDEIDVAILSKISDELPASDIQKILADAKYRPLIQALNNASNPSHQNAELGIDNVLTVEFVIGTEKYRFTRPTDTSLIELFKPPSKFVSSLLSEHTLSTILTPEFELKQKNKYEKNTQTVIKAIEDSFYRGASFSPSFFPETSRKAIDMEEEKMQLSIR